VGSGGTETGSFTDGSWISGATIPFSIASEGAITIGPNAGNLWGTLSSGPGTIGPAGALSASFPKGYSAFYCMKYEISQEQYRDFLNSLTRQQQNNRVWTNISGASTDTVYVMSRTTNPIQNQSICVKPSFYTFGPLQFYCELNKVSYSPPSFDPDSIDDGQTYACNFLSWMDAAAYADWAGLRPMTELEFEKACRGPNPSVLNEYAWGDQTIMLVGGFSYNHPHQGYSDQVITNPADSIGNANWGYMAYGPLRNGIFAASSPNHLKCEAGSTYYGIMEMSGNLSEMIVHAGNNAGLTFTGLHGDGELNTNGEADVDFWPGIGGNTSYSAVSAAYSGIGVTGYGGAGARGGGYFDSWQLKVSDRSMAGCHTFGMRDMDFGFRAVRSAPTDEDSR
jgi:hypothetical protein